MPLCRGLPHSILASKHPSTRKDRFNSRKFLVFVGRWLMDIATKSRWLIDGYHLLDLDSEIPKNTYIKSTPSFLILGFLYNFSISYICNACILLFFLRLLISAELSKN